MSKTKILTKKQYEAAMKKIKVFWNKVKVTKLEERKFSKLVDQASAYEDKYFGMK